MSRIIFVGKAGSGKDTLRNRMAEKGFKKEVSYTTRPPRAGEEHGKDYYFVTEEQFLSDLAHNCFYEHNFFNGWYYGTFLSSWSMCDLFIMTPSGVAQIKPEDRKNCFVIYLDINEGIRRERLLKRSSPDSIERRIEADEKDFENFTDFDMRITTPTF